MPGHRDFLIATFFACCVLGMDAAVIHADDPPDESLDRAVTLLFRQLQADRQVLRVEAQRQLIALGLPAIPAVELEIDDAELDQLPYLVSVLERMFVAGCLTAADEAERALERLAQSERPDVSRRATSVLMGHQQLRERRAVAALRELGADVLYDPVTNQMVVGPFGQVSGIVIPGQPATRIKVWIHDDWKGGEAELWHVTRLEHNWTIRTWGMDLYSISGNGLSSESVQRMAGRLANANIQERGAASLGISCNTINTMFGCMISDALPGGAAAAAGLGRDDVIRKMDGQPIPTFNHLVAELLKRSPGESVILEVGRYGNKSREVEVTLDDWHPVVEAQQRKIKVLVETQQRAIELQSPVRSAPDSPER